MFAKRTKHSILVFVADAPIKDINTFIGTFTMNTPPPHSTNDVPMVSVPSIEPLTAENVLWSNTVLAAGSIVGFVVYTGPETRAVMNTSHPETKVGLLDIEINRLAKVRIKRVQSTLCLTCGSDPVHRNFRTFCRSRRLERIPRPLVHLHLPIPNSFLVHYTHQVGSSPHFAATLPTHCCILVCV